MKELSIEEKAKRYDEAIKRAKEYDFSLTGVCVGDIIEDVFPELKEDEDEKIRKALIEVIRHNYVLTGSINHIPTKDILAWLEKQGESYTKSDVDDAYLKGVTNTKKEIEKQYEANYQIRKDIATFIFNYKGDIKDRAKWMDYLGIKVSFIEKQVGQKPAWSEDDDANLVRAQAFIRNTSLKDVDEIKESVLTWITSLKYRVQPQSQWKPSDEQIECHSASTMH